MGALNLETIAQVGFIVKDVEEAKTKFAEAFGMEVPPTKFSGEYKVTQTEYMGRPAPEAACRMAFFNLADGFQLELIEPNEAPSTWRDFLDTHGEGLHHLAFRLKGMKQAIAGCEALGMKLIQKGEYARGNGRYAYLDATEQMKCIIELLEDD